MAKPQWWQTSLLAEAVIDQPGVAIGAGEAEAAGAAQRQRRIAAAIEKKQRLLAALQRDFYRARERRRDEAAGRRPLAAQIDRLDRRQTLAAEALGQREPLIAAAPGIDFGLQRGRRRDQQHRNARDVAAHHRHVAGVVAHAVLLLVGRIVLLIDHDEAEIGVGQKQRRARADHDRQLRRRPRRARCARACAATVANAIPPVVRRSGAAKRSRNCAVSAISGIRIRLCRPRRIIVRHRFEIDLGLARAGDAVDQRDRIAALGQRRFQRRGGGALVGGKIRLARNRDRVFPRPAPAAAPRFRACLRR